MGKKFGTSIFIFRRDLRLGDNTGLIACAQQSRAIIPLFIYDPRQLSAKNVYKSENAVQFMFDSIEDLKKQLVRAKGKLYEYSGQAEKVIEDIIKKNSIDAIFFNRDYTPFARERDERIKNICERHAIVCLSCDDCLLNAPNTLYNSSQKPYQMFSAFFKRAIKISVAKPRLYTNFNFYNGAVKTRFIYKKVVLKINKRLAVRGGAAVAHRILKNLKNFTNYAKQRDIVDLQTTLLSAHNKFGTVSIRTVYHAIGKKLGHQHALVRQLYWRDFFTYLAYHYPHVFGHAFKSQFDRIQWRTDTRDFARWKTGKTGFPIVDAGMRELNATGFMHNRVRMIVASFLTKDLLIDWRLGEKYFATKLVDYDPAVNNGNWQWVASTGADAQPYFRIFNPWTQQKKFDPQGSYIKKWVPELKNVSINTIHAWHKGFGAKLRYPGPMMNHNFQRIKAIYQTALM